MKSMGRLSVYVVDGAFVCLCSRWGVCLFIKRTAKGFGAKEVSEGVCREGVFDLLELLCNL